MFNIPSLIQGLSHEYWDTYYRFQCCYASMNAFQDVKDNRILEKFSNNAPIKRKMILFSLYIMEHSLSHDI